MLARTALGTSGRVLVTAIVLIVLMGIITGVFARAYHEAERRGAEEQSRLGEVAMAAGRTTEALDHYRAALALARDDGNYRRALALALLGLRRTAEAETHLAQLLERDPVDGEANLLRARLAASRGDFAETEAFYHRAIYGRWPDDPGSSARRLAARFELIEWLTQMDARAPARAELLRLQAELPDVPFLQRELAERLFALDQPSQAAAILRRELDRRPDAKVAADLARAEMAAGRFPEARTAARRALALDPRDRRSRERLDRISAALALDPTQRGLSAADRFRRSQRLLAQVVAALGGPAGSDAPGATPGGTAGGAAAGNAAGRTFGGSDSIVCLDAGDRPLLANAQRLLGDDRATGPPRPAPGSPAPGSPGPPGAASPTSTPPTASSSSADAAPPPADQKAGTDAADATPEPTDPASPQGRADARIAAAEALWHARVAQCGASDESLAWVFDRIGR